MKANAFQLARGKMRSAYPESSGKRRWVFPEGRALAWLACLKVDFAEILSPTAGTVTATGRENLEGRWRAMMKN